MTSQITGDAAARPGCSPEVEPALGGLNGSATSPPIADLPEFAPMPKLPEFPLGRRLARIQAYPLVVSAHETAEGEERRWHGPVRFHMTFHDRVLADMGTQAAILFRRFATSTLDARGIEVAQPSRPAAERGSTSGESPVPQGTRPDPSPGVVS